MASLGPRTRAAAAIAGVCIFGAGVAAVFVTENGTGAAALLAIGAAAVVVAVLGENVESLEVGGMKFTIRDLARRTYALADEAEERGEDESAARLRAVGRELEALARGYRRLRGSMRSGSERTRALGHVVHEARRLSQTGAFDAADVQLWFERGTPEARITALGLMQGNPALRDFEAALDAIVDSRSPFEQYHGLRLAQMMVADLGPVQRAELKVQVERQRRRFRLSRDPGRRQLAESILGELP
jgi:hypothetical protein